MGFISDLAAGGATKSGKNFVASPADRGMGRAIWREVFGTVTNKEEPHTSRKKPVPGGTYGRSVTGTDTATERLLAAMRSRAPGGWSDDRYEETRHYLGVPFIAISAIMKRMMQAEFQVYHKDSKHPDGKRPVTEDEATSERNGPYDLVKLLERPNNQDSFGMWCARIVQQKFLTGTGLNWLVPNKLGTPIEMYPVPTALAIPQPAVNPDYPDGFYRIQPVYPYGPFSSYPTPASAVGAAIPAQWMMKFQFPHPYLRYDGFSPLTGLRLHIDEVDMMDQSRFYKMKRSSNPDVILNFDGMDEAMDPLPEGEINRIRAEWEAEFQGPDNHGRMIVGTPGSKLEPFGGPSPKEMDYTSSWDQLVSFVLGGFGVTKPAAGMVEDSSYSTLFATIKQFNLITLDPECDDIGSQLTRNLAPFFGDDLIVTVRCKRIDDHEITRQNIQLMIQAKAMTKNEARKELGLPLTMEKWGDEIAGSESPPEQPPGQMPGQMPGTPAGDMSGVPQEPVEAPEENPLVALMTEDDENRGENLTELERTRPDPGPSGEGSMGPRKNLNKNRIPILNGANGHHKNGRKK